MPDGLVLVVGGATSNDGRSLLRSSELLDLTSGAVRPGPDLSEPQYKLDGAVVSLADGRVVVAGGSRLEVFSPRSGRFMVVAADRVPRRSFVTATGVGPMAVLVTGGYDDRIQPSRDARLVPVPPA